MTEDRDAETDRLTGQAVPLHSMAASDAQAPTAAQLACLARWIPILDSSDLHIGAWRGGVANADGVISMPWFEYDPQVAAWPGPCDGDTLVLMGFDWGAWMRTPRGVALSADPVAIADATAEELLRLVTAIVRGDRFVEGNLAGAIEEGFALAICRRAAALLGS